MSAATTGSPPLPAHRGERRIACMTSPQFARAVAACDTVLLPLASIEQGGRHCPLGTDLLAADAVACRIAEAAGCLVAPTIPYGDALELCAWPGTIDAGTTTFAAYVEAVASALLRQGFRSIVFLGCHSLDLRAVDGACRRLRAQGYGVAAIDWWKAVAAAAQGETQSPAPFGHCGEVITSAMLAIAPDAVDLAGADDEAPLPGLAFALAHGPGSPFVAYGTFADYCRSGAWGEVKAVASADRGRVWIDRAIADAARFIDELRCALPPTAHDQSAAP
jgi:creatinine amidohydrolase